MSYPPILKPTERNSRERAIASATSVVRAYCGWHVTPVHRERITVDGDGERVALLPSKKILEVHEATVNGDPVELEWSESGAIRLANGGRFPNKYRTISVELTHGFDDASEIAGLVLAVAERVMMNPTGVVVSQRAGTQSRTLASSSGGATGHVPLLATEKAMLEPYRLNWGL